MLQLYLGKPDVKVSTLIQYVFFVRVLNKKKKKDHLDSEKFLHTVENKTL